MDLGNNEETAPLQIGEVSLYPWLEKLVRNVYYMPKSRISIVKREFYHIKCYYDFRFSSDRARYPMSLTEELMLVRSNPLLILRLCFIRHRFPKHMTAGWLTAVNTDPTVIKHLGPHSEDRKYFLKQDDEPNLMALIKLAVKMNPKVLIHLGKWQGSDILSDLFTEEEYVKMTEEDPEIYPYIPEEAQTPRLYMKYRGFENGMSVALLEASESSRTVHLPDIRKQNHIDLNRPFGVEIEFIKNGKFNEVEIFMESVIRGGLIPSRHAEYRNKDAWRLIEDYSWPDMLELVSPPIKTATKFRNFCRAVNMLSSMESLRRIKMNSACGLHVHVDASDLSFDDVLWINDAYRRHMSSIHRLVKPHRLHCPHSLPPLPLRPEDKTDVACSGKWKYFAVNLHAYFKYGTIEFRMHEGTLCLEEILHWVHVVQSIVNKGLENSSRSYFVDEFFKQFDIDERTRRFYRRKLVDNSCVF